MNTKKANFLKVALSFTSKLELVYIEGAVGKQRVWIT